MTAKIFETLPTLIYSNVLKDLAQRLPQVDMQISSVMFTLLIIFLIFKSH
uniref:Uncharacterized protein n=1 Tax=Anguilla anguilla TaxID=7936 RepID=A0A0E9PBA2_ANGAN